MGKAVENLRPVSVKSTNFKYPDPVLSFLLMQSAEQIKQKLIDDLNWINKVCISVREKEVIRWLKAGKTKWETAKILGISENTVRHHVKSIKRKLGASTIVEAVAIAIKHNLID